MSIPESVPNASDLFGAKIKQIARFCEEPEWTAYNPSICYTEEHGYLVLLRSSNGWLRDHRKEWQTELGEELTTQDSYETPGEWYQAAYINSVLGTEKSFRNRLFIGTLNPSTLTLSKIKEVDLTQAYKKFHVDIFRGIEDGRLYHDGNTFRISATIWESEKIPVARMCNLPLDMSSGKPVAGDIEMFDSPVDEDTVEKNWMPVHRTSLYNEKDIAFDYIYNPGQTFTIKTKELTNVGGPTPSRVRGGGQLIGLENGTMLGIIHQCVSAEYIRFANLSQEPLFRRRYVHRFMQYNEQGQIIKTTDMFNFLNKSVEFAAGLTTYNDKVLVSFGALDSSSHVASIPLKKILSALRPLNIQ
jgi:predicted GH43/DUF377 family glycosyl hydrolase